MVRVGVAGVGFGATVHIPVFASLPHVEVAGVAATSKLRADAVASRFGIPFAVDSVEALLDLDLDAIVLALPPDVNERALELATQHRVAIFSEKPLARRAGVAERMARDAGHLVTAVDFEFAELASFQAAAATIRSGDLGRVCHAHVRWLTLSRALQNEQWSWKTDGERGGGVLNLFGSQAVHLLEHLVGPVDSVVAVSGCARTASFAPADAVPALETVSALVRLHDGVDVSLVLSNAARGSQVHEWTIVLERGTLIVENRTMDPASGFTCMVTGNGGPVLVASDAPGEIDGRLRPVRTLAARFTAAVRNHSSMTPDFTVAARVQRVLETVELAARNGARVRPAEVEGG